MDPALLAAVDALSEDQLTRLILVAMGTLDLVDMADRAEGMREGLREILQED